MTFDPLGLWFSEQFGGDPHRCPRLCARRLRGVEAGHAAVRVEPAQQRVADVAQLLELRGRELVEHVAPHGGDVSGRGGDDVVPTRRR